MSSIQTINSGDLISGSRTDINNNFSALNTDKIETSVIDTDTTLAANSDSKIASQKATKAYADSVVGANASETAKGVVEEATDAEVTAGTATGSTGAKLIVTPAKLATRLGTTIADSTANTTAKKYSVGALDNALVKTYFNMQLPFTLWTGAVVNDTTTTFANWSRTDATKIPITRNGLQAVFASTSDAELTLDTFYYPNGINTVPPYNGGTGTFILDFWAKYVSGTGECLMGFFSSPSSIYTDNMSGVGFQFVNGVAYAIQSRSDPTGAEERTNVGGSITETNWNNYRIELDLSVGANLYINGTLVESYVIADAAFPTGAGAGNLVIGFGRDTTNPVQFSVLAPNLSIEMNP